MVVLQKDYEFVDRPSHEVSQGWKFCHITLFVIAAGSGLAAYYVFISLEDQFGDNCILYPNISFMIKNASDNVNDGNKVIDESKTIWGNHTLCDFCEYVPVMSMIIGVIFITFFTMCPKGGTNKSQTGIKYAWHIVLPTLICTGIFTIIITISVINVKYGLSAFCAEFESELNITKCTADIKHFSLKNKDNPVIKINLLLSLFYICLGSWIIAFICVLLRCCYAAADFKLLEVTISTVEDEREPLEETEILLEQNPTSSPVSHV